MILWCRRNNKMAQIPKNLKHSDNFRVRARIFAYATVAHRHDLWRLAYEIEIISVVIAIVHRTVAQ